MTQDRQPGFIAHLHAFRGVAIVNIVAVHAGSLAVYDFGGGTAGDPALRAIAALNEALFHDSTLYFALISGLLFSAVLKDRGWARFFEGKLKYVLAPYAVMSLVFTLFHWHWSQDFEVFGEGPLAFVQAGARHILLGTAMGQFWYIPVLAVLFALTPLVSALLSRSWGIWAVGALGLAPLLVTRTGAELSVQNAVYFLGAYAGGMALGRDYATVSAGMSRIWPLLALLAGVTSALLVWMVWNGTGLAGPVRLQESVFYLQKAALAGLFLAGLKAIEPRVPRVLDTLAGHAFAIYFLHLFVLYAIGHVARLVIDPPLGPLAAIALMAGLLAGSLAICVAISAGARAVLGKRARMILGS
ncbi:acyltransferase family protein [Marinicauda algicola]|uniref:acyltransferase family protein n=1 Tax=Marinicauda algicola TaxID=2029849 RepID=UPI001305446B|nr:acyltransferase [Marinicauda algicola]